MPIFSKSFKKAQFQLRLPKKGKTVSQETINRVQAFNHDDEYIRQLPGKRDCTRIGKMEYNKKCLVLCHLYKLYIVFKKKIQNVSIGLSNFVPSVQRGVPLLSYQVHTHSVQNTALLVVAIN